jgi:hypothetical protein
MSKNAKEISKSLKAYKKEVIKILTEEMQGKAEDILKDMTVRCPVDTGALKASLSKKDDNSTYKIRTGADYGMYYGGYVEPLRPYIRPSYAKNLRDLENIRFKIGAKKKK